jgi:hypothetical protein
MKARNQAIKELSQLRPVDLLEVYNLIISLKDKAGGDRSEPPTDAYLRVREALKGCRGALADDILAAREDRI